MKITLASIATILVFVGSFGAEALPSPHTVKVGRGDECNATHICNPGLVCGKIPGKTGDFCLNPYVGEGGRCDKEYNQCDSGLKCDIKPGQYSGICKRASALRRRGYVERVGKGDICDDVRRICHSGLTCTSVPNRAERYCVNMVYEEGAKCNNEYDQCIYRCIIKPGQHMGHCQTH
jgi:hypothetical protein